MIKRNILLSLLCSCSSLFGAVSNLDFSLDNSYPQNIVINNRILLKVNGKSITVMDVVRKMDLLFYRQYPELASSTTARYQFYMAMWRTMLGNVIDDLLIVADAEEKKLEVNDGEVREELENIFGPDVVLNVDKMGMTLSEAFDLLKTEITVQKMTSMLVRPKAMTEVHPQHVRQKYEEYQRANPSSDRWVYQILSIRGEEHERFADEAYHLLSEGLTLQDAVERLKEWGVDFALSEEYRQSEKELSSAYKAVLATLGAGQYSTPVSRGNSLSRIFCLKACEKEEAISLSEMGEKLKQELLREANARENARYREKLRKHYGMTEPYLKTTVPDHLEPFALR